MSMVEIERELFAFSKRSQAQIAEMAKQEENADFFQFVPFSLFIAMLASLFFGIAVGIFKMNGTPVSVFVVFLALAVGVPSFAFFVGSVLLHIKRSPYCFHSLVQVIDRYEKDLHSAFSFNSPTISGHMRVLDEIGRELTVGEADLIIAYAKLVRKKRQMHDLKRRALGIG